MNIAEQIRARLQNLSPLDLQVEDESSQHAGHAGAASGGGHYRLTIVSASFTGQNAVARHRLIYDSLGDLMKTQIHALAITALSPEEL
jgi:BolA protein